MNFSGGMGSWGSMLILGMVAACGSEAAPGPTAPGQSYAGAPPVVLAPAGSGAAGQLAVAGTGAPAWTATAGTGAVPGIGTGAAGTAAVVTPTPGNTVPPENTGAGAVSQWCGVKQTLDSKCTACHDEKKTAGAPMPLQKYDDLMVAAPSDATKKVYQVVGTRVHAANAPMPPQGMLTDVQLNGIDTWVAAGAPPGADPTCANVAPAQPTTAEVTWPTDCDASYKILSHGTGSDTTPYTVPAGQEIHPSIAVQAPWGTGAVQAIAFRPVTQNPKVLHHWILYGPNREFLTGWAPGQQEITLSGDDIGMNMAGGRLTLDMHYNNLQGTAAEPDNSGVEICILKPEHFRKNTATVYMGFTQLGISIPAHSTNFDVTGSCTVSGTTPVTLLSTSPHAHVLANHMKFTVKKASGETIVMHDQTFDFNEQQSYPLDKALTLGAGDVVTTTCTYSNPSDRTVTFGEDTGNEMCFNFASYYPMNALNCGGGLGGFSFPSF